MNQKFQNTSIRGRISHLIAGCLGIMLLGLISSSVVYSAAPENHTPVVKNVDAQQRPGTRLVDITYDVEDADGDSLEITVEASDDDGKTYTIIPKLLAGDIGQNITPGIGKKIVWDVGEDLLNTKGENFKVGVIAKDGGPDENMVLIPAGEFSMGDHHNVGWDGEEELVHTVYLDAYFIDVYEVTNAQYAKFLNDYGKNIDAAGHELLDIDSIWCLIEKVGDTYKPKGGYKNHPVIEVSWYGAAAYAQFYGKHLPTEAEWEKAARGGLKGKKYPWGDNITHDDANYDMLGETFSVGLFAPNGYGLYDMSGNVWEWCADEYDSDYYSKSPKNNPKGPGIAITFKNDDFTNGNTSRVLRGGSWFDDPDELRCAFRDWGDADYMSDDVGFRCAQDAEEMGEDKDPIVTLPAGISLTEGDTDTSLDLDDYVTDPDNKPEELLWIASGYSPLVVDINGASHQVTIHAPKGSAGPQSITFTAYDPDGNTGSANLRVTVNIEPVVKNIPDIKMLKNGRDTSINLDKYVTDEDGLIQTITWEAIGATNIIVEINLTTHVVTLTPKEYWVGEETITFQATDLDGNEGSDEIVVTVVDDPPIIIDIPIMLIVSPGSVPYKSSEIKVEIKLVIDVEDVPREQKIGITYKKPSGQEIFQQASPKETGSNTHAATLSADKIDEIGTWTVTAHWDGNDEYIPVDGSATFGVTPVPGGINWTIQSKEVPIDKPVSITGTLKTNIEGEIVALEFIAPDGIVKEFTVKTNADGKFQKEYTFDSEGNWTLKASWSGNDTYQKCESITPVHVIIEAPKAIVVLGGDNILDFDDFNTIANKVYDVLTKRGFKDEDLYYLNPKKIQDDERIHVDALTSKSELEHAITVWAAEYVGPHTPLLIYLLSHNTVDNFLLEPPRNLEPHLTPDKLNKWISELESKAPGVSITIFIDACSSGNFMPTLSKEGRTVITSTSVDEPAHIRLADSFSSNFFDRINVDYDVKSTFIDASDIIAEYRGQNPLLDANGDGVPNEKLDYNKVAGVKIGKPMAAKPPTIESVLFLPSQVKQGETAVISVNVSGALIKSVTGVLIPPSYDREREFERWSELDTGLIEIDFQQSDDVRVHASKPQEFTESGKYILIVHADNPDGDAIPYKTQIKVEASESVQPSDKKIAQWGKIKATMLYQNYPNPFNPDTWIPFRLANQSEVTLTIYNIKGEIIRRIELGAIPAGMYLTKDKAIHWDGRSRDSELVASGIYFYQLCAGDYVSVKRMLILK